MAGAAGDSRLLNDILARFDFGPAEEVSTFDALMRRLHQQSVDLVMVPFDLLSDQELSTLLGAMQHAPTLSVIATAPVADPDLILRVLRAGIHEFLVRPVTADELSAVLERRVHRAMVKPTRGQVIAVYGSNGGVGVTTIAIGLAFQCAKTPMLSRGITPRVALADLVLGRGDIRVLLNLTARYDINDLIARQNRVDADVLYSLLTECRGGVWVLPAAEDPQDIMNLDAATTTGVITQLQSNFDMTVIDCESHLSSHTIAALDAADHIVLVTQLTLPMLRSTQRQLQLFRRLGYADDKIAVVVNRFRSADVVSSKEAAEIFDRSICCMVPNDFRACARAVAQGQSVVTQDPDSGVSRAMAELANRLISPATASAPGQAQVRTSASQSGIARLLKRVR